MRTKIAQAIQIVLQGSRKVKITFKRDAISDVSYLLGMKSGCVIELVEMDAKVLEVAVQTRNWGLDSNRIVVVTLTNKFDEKWFVQRLWRALEKIEVVN